VATLRALIREFFISTGDPREPAKLVLGEIWDKVFAPRNREDLLVDALYEAVSFESDNRPIVWSKSDLAKIVNLETDDVSLRQLDEGTLAQELHRRFRDVALAPDRIIDDYDFEQIARNVTARALAIFERKLRDPENQQLRIQLIESSARTSGLRVSEVESRLSSIQDEWSERMGQVETMRVQMQGIVEELTEALKKINDSGALERKTDGYPGNGELTPEDIAGLQGQLINYKTSLSLYEDRWSMYVDPRNIPLEDQMAARLIMRKVETILKRLEGR
jgi:hypothetical protein